MEQEWPARSPDMSPRIILSGDNLKVCQTQPRDVAELGNQKEQEARSIPR